MSPLVPPVEAAQQAAATHAGGGYDWSVYVFLAAVIRSALAWVLEPVRRRRKR